jgi:hypothetical protein
MGGPSCRAARAKPHPGPDNGCPSRQQGAGCCRIRRSSVHATAASLPMRSFELPHIRDVVPLPWPRCGRYRPRNRAFLRQRP